MNENMEFPGAAGDYIEWLQNSFVKVIQKQIDDSYLSHNIMPKEDRGKVNFIFFLNITKKINYHKISIFILQFTS